MRKVVFVCKYCVSIIDVVENTEVPRKGCKLTTEGNHDYIPVKVLYP